MTDQKAPNELKDMRREIILARLQMWKNSQYQAVIDHRVALKLGDQDMVARAKKEAVQCEIALMELYALLDNPPADEGLEVGKGEKI